MCTFDWETFLTQWSQEILEARAIDSSNLPQEVIDSGWLGYPGATEEQLNHVETRLAVSLPPSYRKFLKVSNGWRQTTHFIDRLWSTDEIDWFARRHQDWINRYVQQQHPNSSSNGREVAGLSISDSEYFVYGEQQDCRKLRSEYLQTALEISDKRDAAIYLLNPQVISESGEWEAWFFGDWLPGADRYLSFQEMMQAEYQTFLDMREV